MLARIFSWAGIALLALLVGAPADGRALSLEEIGTFAKPIYVTSDPEDPDRLFVVEREGLVKLVEGEDVDTFLDMSAIVRCCEGEQGMASIALAPDFGTSGKLYVAYTGEDGPGNIHVDELVATGDSADPETRREVLTVPHSDSNIHNGGQLQFGPDGLLYLSTGDGGGPSDQAGNAQSIDSRLGKILRIDPQPDPPLGYTAPPDNPFAGGSEAAKTIWALGLRNPFRFSFDRDGGGLAIADVGETAREEINWAPSPGGEVAGGAGANYGWSCREGLIAGPALDPACAGKGTGDFVEPAFDYPHVTPGNGVICSGSIIGGYVVRDAGLGDLYGRYVYGDYCTGEVRALRLPSAPGQPASDDCSLGINLTRVTSFGEDAAGRLYLTSHQGGVYRLGPPFAGCFAGEPPQTPPPGPIASPRPKLAIGSDRRRVKPGARVSISVRVAPCAGNASRRVTLLRGGRKFGSKRFGRDCLARFRVRIRHRTTFRASLPGAAGGAAVRSPRLTIVVSR